MAALQAQNPLTERNSSDMKKSFKKVVDTKRKSCYIK
jgi:hypothetical protein